MLCLYISVVLYSTSDGVLVVCWCVSCWPTSHVELLVLYGVVYGVVYGLVYGVVYGVGLHLL